MAINVLFSRFHLSFGENKNKLELFTVGLNESAIKHDRGYNYRFYSVKQFDYNKEDKNLIQQIVNTIKYPVNIKQGKTYHNLTKI